MIFILLEQFIHDYRRRQSNWLSPLPPQYDLNPHDPVHDFVILINYYTTELAVRHESVEVILTALDDVTSQSMRSTFEQVERPIL